MTTRVPPVHADHYAVTLFGVTDDSPRQPNPLSLIQQPFIQQDELSYSVSLAKVLDSIRLVRYYDAYFASVPRVDDSSAHSKSLKRHAAAIGYPYVSPLGRGAVEPGGYASGFSGFEAHVNASYYINPCVGRVSQFR
ncbi:hypothetical protein H4R33_007261 [Dimargaris cristalligena]|nr:hypothetical protein H4R33_007261 [Dimargaris cristalligena]